MLKIVTSHLPQWAITLGPFTKAINTLASFISINPVRDCSTIDTNEGWRERWERLGLVVFSGNYIIFHVQHAMHHPYGPVFCNLHRSRLFQAYGWRRNPLSLKGELETLIIIILNNIILLY